MMKFPQIVKNYSDAMMNTNDHKPKEKMKVKNTFIKLRDSEK